MRQLLIVAIESEDALDIDHLSIHVPRLIQNARAQGVLLDGQVTGGAVAAAAKDCVARLPTETNVGIYPELSRGEAVTMGLRLLADAAGTIVDFDQSVRTQWRPAKPAPLAEAAE